jgi:glutaminyl-peptide cyclotransferase
MKICCKLTSFIFLLLPFSMTAQARQGGTSFSHAELAACYDLPLLQIEIISELPHSTTAFTQGLLLAPDGYLYESTGIKGHSELRQLDAVTGEILLQRDIQSGYFGEGLALLDGTFFQLTWQAGVVLRWDSELNPLTDLQCDTPGWGLTAFDGLLLQSDGSNHIYWRSPHDFGIIHQLEIALGGVPLHGLNELEIVQGSILANVIGEDFIVRISPEDGTVNAIIDAGPLRERIPRQAPANVLNGIAWDSKQELLYLTGKNWPTIFVVQIAGS